MKLGPGLKPALAGGAALLLAACADNPLGVTASASDHCVSALGRMVRQGDAVEVWDKKVSNASRGARGVRVVQMDVTVAGTRTAMECVYARQGNGDALSIRLGGRRLSPAQLAAVNAAVRENQDIGAQVRKRLPSPPDVGRFSFSPENTRRKK